MDGIINKPIELTAVFPSSKAGLTTVGYTLKNTDGSIYQNRATTGVVNFGGGTFGTTITFPSAWSGVILWDTGEDIPLYASEGVNISGYPIPIGDAVNPSEYAMYTPQDIANKAARMIDENITDQLLIVELANDFQDNIAKSYPILTSVEITATANIWTNLPVDLIKIDTIENTDGTLYTDTFEIRETTPRKIRFPSSGTYTVFYAKSPYKLTSANNAFEMHPYLQGLGALFMASRFKSLDDDENPDAVRLMKEYEEKRDSRVAKLLKPSSKPKPTKDVYNLW